MVVWRRDREPEYGGKKLSEWVEIGRPLAVFNNGRTIAYEEAKEAKKFEAEASVRKIGPNALPFLVKWIGAERPYWKAMLAKWYVKLPPAFRNRSTDRWLRGKAERERGLDGVMGLCALGQAASPALPELRRLATRHRGTDVWNRVLAVLYSMGPDGQTALHDLGVRDLGLEGSNNSVGLIPNLE